MERNYDLPNGDRVWDLASEAVRIENSAKESVGFSYKLFESMVSAEADRAMQTMDPVEQGFFVTCFQGVYVAPELRSGGDLIEAEGLSDLFRNGSAEEMEQAQRKIDAHIKRRCLSLERGIWPGDESDGPLPSYTKEAVYPSASDDYDSCESPSQIMASNVLPNSKSELDEIYETNQGEFQPRGVTHYHLVARFSEEGTRWAIAGFYQDDFDDWFNRTTIVSTFDSLKDASRWVKSEHEAIEPKAARDEIKAKESREISAVPAGDEVKKTPAAELAAAERALDDLIHRRRDRLDRASEDSYATRNELWDDIAQFGRFLHSVKSAEPGETLNLTQKIVDYGYDPEAAASDHECGLEYVSDFNHAKGVYESCIWEISPMIENLEAAGIRVETGVISMAPPERDEATYDVEMEMER
jgi:hypothetical protein